VLRKVAVFLVALTPLGAFAQSLVWETEIAGQRRKIQSVDDRVHVAVPDMARRAWNPGGQVPFGTVSRTESGGAVVTLAPGKTLRDAIESARGAGLKQVAPVFIEQSGKPGASGVAREYVLTPKILVRAADEAAARKAAAIANAQSFYATVANDRWMLTFADAQAVIEAYARLQAAGLDARPQFKIPAFKKAAPNDPLYPRQWHLKNTGQPEGIAGIDANVEPVWDTGNRGAGQTGSRQVIAVLDDGVQLEHPDLAPNALPSGGDFQTSNHWNFNAEPQNNNPGDLVATGDKKEDHGTNSAGVALSKGNNSIGGSGSAPDAGLIGLRLIAGGVTDENAGHALGWRTGIVTISSNSWGYDDDNSVTTSGPDVLARAALDKGIAEGRGGRGIIYTVAGGNGGTANYRGKGPGVDESNYDGFANHPFTIAVGGNSDKGLHNFAETGCNLVVTAPTGGEGTDQNITTTALVGTGTIEGFPDYTNGFNGTSSSTPLVSGVIALMLTAKPELGWRDVQEILIRTSRKIDNEDASWKTNGAGLPFRFSNRYGAGMVNAEAAVNLSKTWTNLGPQTSVTRNVATPAPIPDGSETGATHSFDFAGTNLRVEQVQFTVDVTHPRRGDLEYVLIAPSGMQSVVNRRINDDTADLKWTFLSVQHWGEQSNGTWTLQVRDRAAGNVGTINSSSIKIFGTGATVATPTKLANIATRLNVGAGSDVLIGGIIITGNQPKRIMLRAIGPSTGVEGALQDPQLELNFQGETVATNDNWQDAPNRQEIVDSTIAPKDARESAILRTVNPGAYTAIVSGVGGSQGVGLVEAYDLGNDSTSKFANIATRGSVRTGSNVMIGGLIVVGSSAQKVLVRALGPSLPLEGKLLDPSLDLIDGNGTVVRANDNWRSSQETEIQATTIPPQNDAEAAVVETLLPGSYTAVVRGVGETTGIGLVEVYGLQ
jgi:subtilisin-like proprotein convertase family protein